MKPRIAAIIEARTVTGPAKNLIRFASQNRERLDLQFFTFARTASETDAERHTDRFIEAAHGAGIPVSVIWERARFDRSVASRLADRVLSFQPQAVQTHSVKSHFLFARLARRIGVPWIAFHHGYTAEDLKMRLYNQLDRFSLTRATAVVTVCQAFATDIARYGIPGQRLHVLHNSLEPSWAHTPGLAERAAAIRSGLPGGGALPVFLCVGRFSKEKGHEILMRAAALLRARRCIFVLVGDGPLRRHIQDLARRKSLEDSVVFAGQQPEVRAYFAAADALVLPSLSEGSPNVLLEAMAAKLPIVATRVGGVPEIVSDNDSGLLVPSGNPGALARAIERIIDDPDLRNRLRRSAYQRLQEQFSPQKYDSELFGIYGAILDDQSIFNAEAKRGA